MEGRTDRHLAPSGARSWPAPPHRSRNESRRLEPGASPSRARADHGPDRARYLAASGQKLGPDRNETVHLTASRWWQRKQGELRPNAQADYRWRLDYVLADLAREPTADIDPKRVDEFRQKLVGRGLSPRSVNMVLGLLAQILDDAVEYGLLAANPARGRRRRMRERKSSRSFLEPDMVVDLLDAAGEWEASRPPHQRVGRRVLLALLCLAGPRVGEVIAADRGDSTSQAVAGASPSPRRTRAGGTSS